MATLIGKEDSVVDMLVHLAELDFDAIAAYQAAITRLDSPRCTAAMQEFMNDHVRHTRELAPIIVSLGGKPPLEGDLKGILTQGKVVIGQIAGDTGILAAMRSNEQDTNTAYENAFLRTELSEHARAVLSRGLSDERRHKQWIEKELAQPGGRDAGAMDEGDGSSESVQSAVTVR